MNPHLPPGRPLRAPEAAQRFFDDWCLHRTVLTLDELLAGRWMAVRLADGGSDRTAYDTYSDAVHSARNSPSRCGYPRILPEAMSVQWCDFMLWYWRTCYDNGWREDPAAQLIVPTRIEDVERRIVRTVNWRR